MEQNIPNRKPLKQMVRMVQTQQVIVNGVPQGGVTVPQLICVCPRCNAVITEFNVGVDIADVTNYISNELKETVKYCPKCGQNFSYPAVIEVECVEETVQEEIDSSEEKQGEITNED